MNIGQKTLSTFIEVTIGAAMCFLGVAAGWWIMGIGLIPTIIGVVGWVMEFSRGEHAH